MSFSRMDRVQNLLKTAIATIVDRELNNPKLPDLITIDRVKVSKDLSYATVLVTFLADTTPEQIKETMEELNKASGYINKLVSSRVQLRRHPQLRFVYNPSTHYALDIEKIFVQIHNEPPIIDSEEPDAESEPDGQPGNVVELPFRDEDDPAQ